MNPVNDINDEVSNANAIAAINLNASLSLTPQVKLVYMQKHEQIKTQADDLYAQVSVRNDRLSFLNDIRAAINSATKEDNSLDLTNENELKLKMKRAVDEFGVDLPKFDEKKMKYESFDKERLLQNIELIANSWDKENKAQTSKIETLTKESDRILTMLTSTSKNENETGKQVARNIKG